MHGLGSMQDDPTPLHTHALQPSSGRQPKHKKSWTASSIDGSNNGVDHQAAGHSPPPRSRASVVYVPSPCVGGGRLHNHKRTQTLESSDAQWTHTRLPHPSPARPGYRRTHARTMVHLFTVQASFHVSPRFDRYHPLPCPAGHARQNGDGPGPALPGPFVRPWVGRSVGFGIEQLSQKQRLVQPTGSSKRKHQFVRCPQGGV